MVTINFTLLQTIFFKQGGDKEFDFPLSKKKKLKLEIKKSKSREREDDQRNLLNKKNIIQIQILKDPSFPQWKRRLDII